MSEELLALAREVNSKGFEERLKRSIQATNDNIVATRKLSRQKARMTKRENDFQREKSEFEADVKVFGKQKERDTADLDARRAQLVKAEAEAQGMKAGAVAELQAAKQNLAEARRLMKKAEDKETTLAPTLKLVEQLRA